MLKNFNDLTFKNLKKNKRRFTLTNIGVVLAMILITMLCTFIPTIINSLIKQERSLNGNWHIEYTSLEHNIKDKIKVSPNVEEILEYKVLGNTGIKKATITLVAYEGNLGGFYDINLIKGRLPENNNEIIIDDLTLNKVGGDFNVGSNIDLFIKNMEKRFKIVGIIKGDLFRGDAKAYTKETFDEKSSLLVKVKEDKNMKESIEKLKSISSITNTNLNNYLNSFFYNTGEDNSYESLFIFIGILILVVVLATIFIIYNSFNISIEQRSKEIIILRTLGTTEKEIKKLVKYEAKLITLIAVPIGTILGLLFFKGFIYFYNNFNSYVDTIKLIYGTELEMIISYKALIVGVLIGVITIYISSLKPSKKAARTSPIEAIRSNYLINNKKIDRKSGKFLKRVLKVDKLIVYKNIKRNKVGYIITVFSISISLLIFMLVYSLNNFMFTDLYENESRKIDLIVNISDPNDNNFNKLKDYIKNVDDIEKFYNKINTLNYEILLNKNQINSDLYNYKKKKNKVDVVEYNGKEYVSVEGSFNTYEKERIDECYKYLKNGNAYYNSMVENNEVLILKNTLLRTESKDKTIQGMNLNVGDEIVINLQGDVTRDDNFIGITGVSESEILSFGVASHNSNIIEKENVITLKVAGVLEYPPFDTNMYNKLGIIIADKTAESIFNNLKEKNYLIGHRMNKNQIEVVLKDKNKAKYVDSLIENKLNEEEIYGGVTNVIEENERIKIEKSKIKVVTYGFTVVIFLISLINLINTISSNISLRRREFVSFISIGVPMKKIINMIITEVILYVGAASIISGIVGWIMCNLIISTGKVPGGVKIYNYVYTAIAIGSIIVILISVIATIPSIRKIKKVNIIDELRVE